MWKSGWNGGGPRPKHLAETLPHLLFRLNLFVESPRGRKPGFSPDWPPSGIPDILNVKCEGPFGPFGTPGVGFSLLGEGRIPQLGKERFLCLARPWWFFLG